MTTKQETQLLQWDALAWCSFGPHETACNSIQPFRNYSAEHITNLLDGHSEHNFIVNKCTSYLSTGHSELVL